jgi:hypothetical protein
MLHVVSNDINDFWGNDYTREIYTGAKFDGIGEGEDGDGHDLVAEERCQMQLAQNFQTDGHIDVEHILLHLPSYLGRSWCNTNAAEDLANAELRPQEGQLNNSLHHICIALGHTSYLF